MFFRSTCQIEKKFWFIIFDRWSGRRINDRPKNHIRHWQLGQPRSCNVQMSLDGLAAYGGLWLACICRPSRKGWVGLRLKTRRNFYPVLEVSQSRNRPNFCGLVLGEMVLKYVPIFLGILFYLRKCNTMFCQWLISMID